MPTTHVGSLDAWLDSTCGPGLAGELRRRASCPQRVPIQEDEVATATEASDSRPPPDSPSQPPSASPANPAKANAGSGEAPAQEASAECSPRTSEAGAGAGKSPASPPVRRTSLLSMQLRSSSMPTGGDGPLGLRTGSSSSSSSSGGGGGGGSSAGGSAVSRCGSDSRSSPNSGPSSFVSADVGPAIAAASQAVRAASGASAARTSAFSADAAQASGSLGQDACTSGQGSVVAEVAGTPDVVDATFLASMLAIAELSAGSRGAEPPVAQAATQAQCEADEAAAAAAAVRPAPSPLQISPAAGGAAKPAAALNPAEEEEELCGVDATLCGGSLMASAEWQACSAGSSALNDNANLTSYARSPSRALPLPEPSSLPEGRSQGGRELVSLASAFSSPPRRNSNTLASYSSGDAAGLSCTISIAAAGAAAAGRCAETARAASASTGGIPVALPGVCAEGEVGGRHLACSALPPSPGRIALAAAQSPERWSPRSAGSSAAGSSEQRRPKGVTFASLFTTHDVRLPGDELEIPACASGGSTDAAIQLDPGFGSSGSGSLGLLNSYAMGSVGAAVGSERHGAWGLRHAMSMGAAYSLAAVMQTLDAGGSEPGRRGGGLAPPHAAASCAEGGSGGGGGDVGCSEGGSAVSSPAHTYEGTVRRGFPRKHALAALYRAQSQPGDMHVPLLQRVGRGL